MTFDHPTLSDSVFDLDTGDTTNALLVSGTQGANRGEARIGVDLGFNFMTTYKAGSTELFTISSTIRDLTDGFEIYFLSSGFTSDANPCTIDCGGGSGEGPVVPEPASLLLFGTGLVAVAGLRQRMKKRG